MVMVFVVDVECEVLEFFIFFENKVCVKECECVVEFEILFVLK